MRQSSSTMRCTKAHTILEETRDFAVTNISELADKVRFLDGGNRLLAFLEEGDSIARDVLALAWERIPPSWAK